VKPFAMAATAVFDYVGYVGCGMAEIIDVCIPQHT